DDQVDVGELAARDDGLDRAAIGVQLELLPQRPGHRAVATAQGCREGALEREAGAADALERRIGERRAGLLDGRHPAVLLIPVELCPQGFEHLEGRLCDLGPDAVAADERRVPPHGSPGVTLFIARPSELQGSSPSPRATVRHSIRPKRTSTIAIDNSAVALCGGACSAPVSPEAFSGALGRRYTSAAGTRA